MTTRWDSLTPQQQEEADEQLRLFAGLGRIYDSHRWSTGRDGEMAQVAAQEIRRMYPTLVRYFTQAQLREWTATSKTAFDQIRNTAIVEASPLAAEVIEKGRRLGEQYGVMTSIERRVDRWLHAAANTFGVNDMDVDHGDLDDIDEKKPNFYTELGIPECVRRDKWLVQLSGYSVLWNEADQAMRDQLTYEIVLLVRHATAVMTRRTLMPFRQHFTIEEIDGFIDAHWRSARVADENFFDRAMEAGEKQGCLTRKWSRELREVEKERGKPFDYAASSLQPMVDGFLQEYQDKLESRIGDWMDRSNIGSAKQRARLRDGSWAWEKYMDKKDLED